VVNMDLKKILLIGGLAAAAYILIKRTGTASAAGTGAVLPTLNNAASLDSGYFYHKAEQIIPATDNWYVAGSAVIPNNGDLSPSQDPYQNGPQSITNPSAATADYSSWGGTLAAGGSLFNSAGARNPSAELIFDRGLGVYR